MTRALTEAEAKDLHELQRSATRRRESKTFVIEGPHLLEEALHASATLELVAFSEAAASMHPGLLDACYDARILTTSIRQKLLERLSETESPQGIIARVRMPEDRLVTGSIVLALDGVQDPGNVGTIIRTANWFGVESIILGGGTADAYGPKVVRSTQGAIFSMKLHRREKLAPQLQALKREGYAISVSSLSQGSESLYSHRAVSPSVLVLGSEAHGVSADVDNVATSRVQIPRYGSGESLNVAISAAIVLAEWKRQGL